MDSLVLIDGRPVEYFFAGPPIAKNILADRAAIGSVTADGKIDIGEFSPDASLEWSEADGTAGKLLLVRYEKSDLGAVQLPPGAQLWVPGEQLGESWSESARAIDPLFERDAGNFAIVTDEDANPIQLIFAEIEPLPLAQSVFEPLPLTDTERKIYSINGEKKKINNREVGNADYVINGTSLPKVLSFGAELLQPTTIHRVTLNRGSLPLVVKRRSVDSTVISGHPDATWILPDGRMLRGDLVLTGSIRGSVLLAADGDRGIPVEVETEDVQPLRCRRCRAQFLPSENYHGACQWHTQHAQLLRIEAEQKLTTINSVITSELEDKPFSSLLRRLNGSLQQSIESKLNFLETATPNRLTLSRSPREMVVSELRKLIEDYRAATNAEELAVRRYARVVVHLLDSRQLKDCLQLPYFDPQDPDQRQIGGFRNPNKRYGLTEDVWQCCGFSGGQRGCWIGRHAETEFPDLQDALNDQRGSQHLSDPNTSEDSYREILAAKEAQDYETLFTLEGLYNEVQGGVLVLPADANDSVKRAVKSLDLTESETTSYWVRDEQRSLTFDGIPDDDLFTKARRSQEYKEREVAKLIFAPPSPPRGEKGLQVIRRTERGQKSFKQPVYASELERQQRLYQEWKATVRLMNENDLQKITDREILKSMRQTIKEFCTEEHSAQYFVMKFFTLIPPIDQLADGELIGAGYALQAEILDIEMWEKFAAIGNPDYDAYSNAVNNFMGYFTRLVAQLLDTPVELKDFSKIGGQVDLFIETAITKGIQQVDQDVVDRPLRIERFNVDLNSAWEDKLEPVDFYQMTFRLDTYDLVWEALGLNLTPEMAQNITSFLNEKQQSILKSKQNGNYPKFYESCLKLWKACVYPSEENLAQLGFKKAALPKPKKDLSKSIDRVISWVQSNVFYGSIASGLAFFNFRNYEPVDLTDIRDEKKIDNALRNIEIIEEYRKNFGNLGEDYRRAIRVWEGQTFELGTYKLNPQAIISEDTSNNTSVDTFIVTKLHDKFSYISDIDGTTIITVNLTESVIDSTKLPKQLRSAMIFTNLAKYKDVWNATKDNAEPDYDEQATKTKAVELSNYALQLEHLIESEQEPEQWRARLLVWLANARPNKVNIKALEDKIQELQQKTAAQKTVEEKRRILQGIYNNLAEFPTSLKSWQPSAQNADTVAEDQLDELIEEQQQLLNERTQYWKDQEAGILSILETLRREREEWTAFKVGIPDGLPPIPNEGENIYDAQRDFIVNTPWFEQQSQLILEGISVNENIVRNFAYIKSELVLKDSALYKAVTELAEKKETEAEQQRITAFRQKVETTAGRFNERTKALQQQLLQLRIYVPTYNADVPRFNPQFSESSSLDDKNSAFIQYVETFEDELEKISREFSESLTQFEARRRSLQQEIRTTIAMYDTLPSQYGRFKISNLTTTLLEGELSLSEYTEYVEKVKRDQARSTTFQNNRELFQRISAKLEQSQAQYPEKLPYALKDATDLDEVSRIILSDVGGAEQRLQDLINQDIATCNEKLANGTFHSERDALRLERYFIKNIKVFGGTPPTAEQQEIAKEVLIVDDLSGQIGDSSSSKEVVIFSGDAPKDVTNAQERVVEKAQETIQGATNNSIGINEKIEQIKKRVEQIVADIEQKRSIQVEIFKFDLYNDTFITELKNVNAKTAHDVKEWEKTLKKTEEILAGLPDQANKPKFAFYARQEQGALPNLTELRNSFPIMLIFDGLSQRDNKIAASTKMAFVRVLESIENRPEYGSIINDLIGLLKRQSERNAKEIFYPTKIFSWDPPQSPQLPFSTLAGERPWYREVILKAQKLPPLGAAEYGLQYAIAYRNTIKSLLPTSRAIYERQKQEQEKAGGIPTPELAKNIERIGKVLNAISTEEQDVSIPVGAWAGRDNGSYYRFVTQDLKMPSNQRYLCNRFTFEFLKRKMEIEKEYFNSINQRISIKYNVELDETPVEFGVVENISGAISDKISTWQIKNLFSSGYFDEKEGLAEETLINNGKAALASLMRGNRARDTGGYRQPTLIFGTAVYWVLLQILDDVSFLECIAIIDTTPAHKLRLCFDLQSSVGAAVYLLKDESAEKEATNTGLIIRTVQTLLAKIAIGEKINFLSQQEVDISFNEDLLEKVDEILKQVAALPKFAVIITEDETLANLDRLLVEELQYYPYLIFGFVVKKLVDDVVPGMIFGQSNVTSNYAIPYEYRLLKITDSKDSSIPKNITKIPYFEIIKPRSIGIGRSKTVWNLKNLPLQTDISLIWDTVEAPIDGDENRRKAAFEYGLGIIKVGELTLDQYFKTKAVRTALYGYYTMPKDEVGDREFEVALAGSALIAFFRELQKGSPTEMPSERSTPQVPKPSKKSPPASPKASQPSPKSPPKPKSPPPSPESSEDEGSTEEVPPEVPKPKDVPTGKDATLFESASFEKLQQMKNANSPAYLLRRTTAKSLTNNIYWNWAQTLKEPAKDRSSSYKNESFSGLSLPPEYHNNLEWMLTFIQDDVSLEGIQELAGEEWAKPIVDPKTKLAKPGLKTVPKEYAVRNEFYSIIPIPFPIMDIALLRQYYALSDTYPSNRIAIRSTHISPRIDIGTVAERMWNARLCDGDVIEKLDRTQLELHKDEMKKAITPNEEFADLAKKYGVKKLVDTFKDLWKLQEARPDPKTLSDDMAILIHLIHSLRRSAELYAFTEELVIRARNTYQGWEAPETFNDINAKLPEAKTFEDLKDFKSEDIQDALLRTLDSATLKQIWKLSVQGFFTNIFLQDELLTEATEDIRIYSVAELNQDDSIRHTIGHAIGRVDSWEKTLESLRYGDGIELKAGKQNLEIEEIVVRKKSNMGQPLLLKMVLDHYASLQQQVESPEKVFVWLKPDLQLFAAGTDNFAEVYQAPKEGLLDLYAKWGFRPDFNVDVPIQLTKIKKLSLRPDDTTVLDDWRLGYLTGALMEIGAREATDVPEPSSLWGPKVGKTGFEGYLNFKVKFAKTMKDFKDVSVPKMQPIYSNSVFNAEQPEDEDRILFRQVKDAAEYTFVKGGAIEVALGNLAPASPAPPPAKKARGRPKKTSQSSEQIQSLENIVDLTSARNPIMGLLFELDDNDMLAPHGYGEFNTWLQEWTKRRTSIGLSFDFPVPLTARRDAILARIDPDLRTLGSQAAQRLAQMK